MLSFPSNFLQSVVFLGHCLIAGYISNSVKDGMQRLMLKCRVSSCYAAVTCDMINILASEEDKFKYIHYFLRSYIEYNKKVHDNPHFSHTEHYRLTHLSK